MGDVVHALPAAAALRRRFPRAHLAWLVDQRFAAIVRGCRAVDEVIAAPALPLPAGWPRPDLTRATLQYSLAPQLRREHFDLVVDLQGLFRTGVLAAATGARRRVGFANAREGAPIFYTHRHRIGRELHAVDRCLQLVATLSGDTPDILSSPPPPVRFDLHPGTAARAMAADQLKNIGLNESQPYVVFCPRSANPYKEWPPDRFAQLAQQLWQHRRLPVLLIGAKADRTIARSIADRAGAGSFVLTGTALEVSMALIAASAGMVANDSGPLHLAVALGVPVVGIYGPTNPARTGPYGRPQSVVRDNSNCPVCHRPRWRIPGHTCLTDLSVDRVLEAVNAALPPRP